MARKERASEEGGVQQTMGERRVVRQEYRALKNDITGHGGAKRWSTGKWSTANDDEARRDCANTYCVKHTDSDGTRMAERKGKHTRADGGDELLKDVVRADALYQNVSKPREQAVDGEVMCKLADHGLELVKNLQSGGAGCTPAALVARLKAQHVPGWNPHAQGAHQADAFQWDTFTQRVARYFRSPPAFTCMLGPLSIQAKQRKAVVRQAKQKAPQHETVQPDQVSTADNADAKQQATDRNMKKMQHVLKNVERTSLARLINNPKSFAQSVENLFTLSFLVRDGKARLHESPQGLEVEYTTQPTEEEFRSGKAEPGQFVMAFTMQNWEEMQRYVGTPTSLIPHREYDQATGKEYTPDEPGENRNGRQQAGAQKRCRRAVDDQDEQQPKTKARAQ